MARREFHPMYVVDDITQGACELVFGGPIRTAVSTTVFVLGGAILIAPLVDSCVNSEVSLAPTIIPTSSCLMDGRPTPSERTYSAKTPDGNSVSLAPSGTIHAEASCPPSSR
jgi:hypothetical protein